MFSRFISCFALLSVLACVAQDGSADVITEGDVMLGGPFSDTFIAQQADGSVTLTAPTVFEGEGIFIAGEPLTTGSLTIDGATFDSDGSDYVIGQGGNGTLTLVNGGRLINDNNFIDFFVGQDAGSLGSVSIQGNGSRLDASEGRARVGNEGHGEFFIENGGYAILQEVSLGATFDDNPSGRGIAAVRGIGSEWNIRGPLKVGDFGIGELRIEEGGLVRSSTVFFDQATIGDGRNSNGNGGVGAVFVEGTGSRWLHEQELLVGGRGTATMDISAGAFVSSGFAYVAGSESSGGGSANVTIDGPGSLWSTNGIAIGFDGTGQVFLSGGAQLISNRQSFGQPFFNTFIGGRPGAFGRLVVDGSTTQWIDNTEELIIGDSGTGELVLQNGAVVSSQSVLLGRSSFGHGSVLLTGLGTHWQVEQLQIGDNGQGKVEVAEGATLQQAPFQDPLLIAPRGELVLTGGTVISPTFIRNEGIVRGRGEIRTAIQNATGSTIRVDDSQRLVLANSVDNPGGRISVIDGELEVRDFFSNRNNGTVALENATLRFVTRGFSQNRLQNESRILVAAGNNRIYGDIENFNSGRIILSGNSQTTFYDGFIENFGTFNVSTGSVATFFGTFLGNGVGGGGTVFLEGDVSPGFSPGVMEFGGDVTLGDFSELSIEVSDEAHDALEIVGSATLGGDLMLSALAALSGDTSLEIISAEAVLGAFDNVPAVGEALGFGVLFGGITYNDDSVVIDLLQQTADFNLDGNVDGEDLATWSAGFGTAAGAELADGDANRDNDTDGGDFLAWQRGFNPAIMQPITTQAVPEPTSAVLALLAGIAVFTVRP